MCHKHTHAKLSAIVVLVAGKKLCKAPGSQDVARFRLATATSAPCIAWGHGMASRAHISRHTHTYHKKTYHKKHSGGRDWRHDCGSRFSSTNGRGCCHEDTQNVRTVRVGHYTGAHAAELRLRTKLRAHAWRVSKTPMGGCHSKRCTGRPPQADRALACVQAATRSS